MLFTHIDIHVHIHVPSTLFSSGVMVAHLIPTWYLLIASAHSTVTEGEAHNSKYCTSQWLLKCTVLTLVTGGVPVLNAKVITLHIQIHIGKDQLFLDQLPDDP